MARLIARRKKLGVTQVELARRAGMTQPNLARYESLSVSPALSALSRLCEALSKDLKEAFPDAKGFAVSNLRYMRRYYELFPGFPIRPQVEGEIGDAAIRPQVSEEILPQVGAKIFMVPWNHVKCILDKCGSDQGKALFYIEETIKNNWSRAVLLNFLGTSLYERKGKALTNFESTLPNIGGDLARRITKDPLLNAR